MVELVVGIFIFALVIGGIVAGMSSSLNLTRQNRNRSIAANLASQEMDTVRSTEFTDLPLGSVTATQTVDAVPYTITRETQWVTPNATSGPCQAPSGSALAYLSVTVSVTWNNMAGVPAPVSHTVVTPPVGTYDTSRGHVSVLVLDAAGAPQEGIPVALTGPDVPETQTTTTDGCAFFAYKPSGEYTVTLSRASYVDDQGIASPVQSATVAAGSTVSLQFQYDGAATLSLSLLGNTGGAAPTSVPVTLGNTHILPSGEKMFTGSGSPRTISGLFPYQRRLRGLGGRLPRRRSGRGRRRRALVLPRGQSRHADRRLRRRDERVDGSHARDPGPRGGLWRRTPLGGGHGVPRGRLRLPQRRHVHPRHHRRRRQPHGCPALRALVRDRRKHERAVGHAEPPGPPDAGYGDGDRAVSALVSRLRRASSEEGITLVELIVTVSIMTVVLGFVTQGFVTLQNAATGASLRLQNLDEARILMGDVSKDVRTAARLSSTASPFDVTSVPSGYGFGNAPPYASNTEVWFYSNLTLSATNPSPCPDIVHLFVDTVANPPVLKEQTVAADAGGTPPSCTYTGSYSTRLVGKYVANPSSLPVFTYYYDDATGTPVSRTAPSRRPCATSTPLSHAANRLLVNAVGITLAIRASTNYTVPYTTLINRVRLPNVDYNPLPSPSP